MPARVKVKRHIRQGPDMEDRPTEDAIQNLISGGKKCWA
jgi:hypothetical protein